MSNSLTEADRERIAQAWRRTALELATGNFPEVWLGDMDCFDPAPKLWQEFLLSRAMNPLVESGLFTVVTRHSRKWYRLVDRAKGKTALAEIEGQVSK